MLFAAIVKVKLPANIYPLQHLVDIVHVCSYVAAVVSAGHCTNYFAFTFGIDVVILKNDNKSNKKKLIDLFHFQSKDVLK